MNIKNTNTYAIEGIESINSNYNASFEDGMPKTDGNGTIKGSPFTLEYSIKALWNRQGKKVLGLKGFDDKGKPFTQEGKIKNMFGSEDISTALKKCIDFKNFGGVIAIKGNNIGMTGTVQVGDALNKFEETEINIETILSPYLNSKKTEVNQTTNGTRITTSEAHYLHPITIMPNQSEMEYTLEDYEDFKQTSLKAVTLYNSKAKMGCKNEFGLFVTIKEEYNYQLALGDLTQYVKVFRDEDDKVVYDLSELNILLMNCKDKIDNIELHYRSIKNKIIGFDLQSLNVKSFDIITGREL